MPMTSEEIRSATEDSKTLAGWVKELCWQIAVKNETPALKLTPNEPIFDRSKTGKK